MSSGALSPIAGSGLTRTATFTPAQDLASGAASITVAAGSYTDPYGEPGLPGTTPSISIDTLRPTIGLSSTRSQLRVGDTAVIGFSLSEPSTDFDMSDVGATGGTLSSFTGSGSSYTALFTASASGPQVIKVASSRFSDLAGNLNVDGSDPNNTLTFQLVPGVSSTSLIGSTRDEGARTLTTGSDGAIYMAGHSAGSIGGSSNAGIRDVFLTKHTGNGVPLWTKMLGTSTIDEPSDLAAGSDGAVFMAVTSQGSFNGAGNSGQADAYLVKFDGDGEAIWTVRQGTTSTDRGNAVAVSANGDVYLAGETLGRSLDGQRSKGSFGAFIAQYNTNGAKVGTTRMLGTSGNDSANALAVDSSGNLFVTGKFGGAYPGQPRQGADDVFLARYPVGGGSSPEWVRVFGSTGSEVGTGIALDPANGSIYIAGYTNGALPGQSRAGNEDAFLAKFSAAGDVLWVRQFGSASRDRATGLSLDAEGSVFLTGFVGGSTGGQTFAGGSDSFVAKYAPDGTRNWIRLQGSPTLDLSYAITIGQDGKIFTAGETNGAEFGGASSAGGYDAFLSTWTDNKELGVLLSSALPVEKASSVRDVFTLATGSYNATITGGFAPGDRLIFPTGYTSPNVVNTSLSDGVLSVSASLPGGGSPIVVTLTGLTSAHDAAVTGPDLLASFRTSFGTSSL